MATERFVFVFDDGREILGNAFGDEANIRGIWNNGFIRGWIELQLDDGRHLTPVGEDVFEIAETGERGRLKKHQDYRKQ